MYLLLKTNKVKSNPFDRILSSKSDLNSNINTLIKRFNGNGNGNLMLLNSLKLSARKCKYILNGSGFKEPVGLSEHFKVILNDGESYETEYANYIVELDSWFKGTSEEKKPKAKVTRKKKTAPAEIDV